LAKSQDLPRTKLQPEQYIILRNCKETIEKRRDERRSRQKEMATKKSGCLPLDRHFFRRPRRERMKKKRDEFANRQRMKRKKPSSRKPSTGARKPSNTGNPTSSNKKQSSGLKESQKTESGGEKAENSVWRTHNLYS
jgi:hypothetical protein